VIGVLIARLRHRGAGGGRIAPAAAHTGRIGGERARERDGPVEAVSQIDKDGELRREEARRLHAGEGRGGGEALDGIFAAARPRAASPCVITARGKEALGSWGEEVDPFGQTLSFIRKRRGLTPVGIFSLF